MTHTIRNIMLSATMLVALAATGVSVASASEVTGSLTSSGLSSGSSVSGTLGGTSGSGGSTVTGTLGGTTGSTITGSVSGGSGGGGGGGGNGPIVGSLGASSPLGQVLGASTGPLTQAQSSGYIPSAPNTGAGGNAPVNELILMLSGLAALIAAGIFVRKTARR